MIKEFFIIIFYIFILPFTLLAQDCKCKVSINTDSDSFVFLNDDFYGKNNLSLELDTGLYQVHIKEFLNKWNAKEIIDTIKITDCNKEYSFFYQVSSIKNIKQDNSLSNEIVNVNLNSKKYWADSKWFKILMGTSLIFGATAAYFKINADKKYEEYLQTGNKNTLKKVNKLDLYSGIAFGLLQINFGYIMYKFLTE